MWLLEVFSYGGKTREGAGQHATVISSARAAVGGDAGIREAFYEVFYNEICSLFDAQLLSERFLEHA